MNHSFQGGNYHSLVSMTPQKSPQDLGNSLLHTQVATLSGSSLLSLTWGVTVYIITWENVHVLEYTIDWPIPCTSQRPEPVFFDQYYRSQWYCIFIKL